MRSPKKPLDPVVKLGLGVLVGSFVLIGVGMFLSRPDRSIPPYSIGAQRDTLVAVHVPPWTSDPELESLVHRFGEVGRTTADFGPMKIRPTTPDNPQARYQRMTLIIFSNPDWATPEALERYVSAVESGQDNTWKNEFEESARAGYLLFESSQKGWIGPYARDQPREGVRQSQVLFNEALAPAMGSPSQP